MSEEKNQEPMATDAPMENQAKQQLQQEIENLKKKNYELIGKMQKKELMEVPDDYKELVEFKRNAEQAELQRDVIEYNGKVAEAKKLEEANFARMSGSIARMQGRQQAIGYLSQAGSSLLTMKQMGMFS